ncbi:hypothetical protein [Streptomyces sp. NPDC059278]
MSIKTTPVHEDADATAAELHARANADREQQKADEAKRNARQN